MTNNIAKSLLLFKHKMQSYSYDHDVEYLIESRIWIGAIGTLGNCIYTEEFYMLVINDE